MELLMDSMDFIWINPGKVKTSCIPLDSSASPSSKNRDDSGIHYSEHVFKQKGMAAALRFTNTRRQLVG